MRLCFMVFAMFSTIHYNIARKRDATASDGRQQVPGLDFSDLGVLYLRCRPLRGLPA